MTEQSWPKIFTDKDDFIKQYPPGVRARVLQAP
jgi:hypothetical protein